MKRKSQTSALREVHIVILTHRPEVFHNQCRIPLKIDQERQDKRTSPGAGPPFSSWITDQAKMEFTQKPKPKRPDKFSMCHKTTRVMVTLEFNNQERKTITEDEKGGPTPGLALLSYLS